MHHHYRITESNFDYTFTITCEFYIALRWLMSFYFTPFIIFCKAGVVVMNSLNSCLGKYLSLLNFWKITLSGIVFLVDSHFLSMFWTCHPILSWKVPDKKSVYSLMGVHLYVTSLFSYCLQNYFCLWLLIIIMCLSVALLWFNLFEVLWASWVWMSISLLRFGKFAAIIALNILSVPFSSPSGIPIMQILFLLIVSPKSHRLFSLLFFFLPSLTG